MWQYVEDLTAALKDPEVFFEALKAKGELDLKEVSDKPEVFLGGSIERDSDGTLAWGAKRYIASCLKDIEREKGELPHKKNAPLPENTHPELDTSPLLNEKDKSRYQSLIGMLQWIATLTAGRSAHRIGGASGRTSSFRDATATTKKFFVSTRVALPCVLTVIQQKYTLEITNRPSLQVHAGPPAERTYVIIY